nr:restriction endonuclease subunit S [Aeriscardovia aeriphila]
MQQIFSQQLRFKADDGSDFPRWEEKKLGEMAILRNGYAFSSSTYVPHGYYHIITIANVRGEHFITVDSSTSTIDELPKNIAHWQVLKENDILISLTGNVGRVSLNRGSNNLLNQRVGLLEVNSTELNVEYLYQRISSADFEQAMLNAGQGAAQQNISKYDIENFRVSIPSLPEQKKIAACLSSADALIDQARVELEQWQEVKKSLLQQLFV